LLPASHRIPPPEDAELSTYGAMNFCNEPENNYGQFPGWVNDHEMVILLWKAAENQEYFGIYDDESGELTWSPYNQNVSIVALENVPAYDVNGDYSLDILDIVLVIEIILDLSDFTPEQIELTDTNNDGSLDIVDVVVIIDVLLDQ